MKEPKAPQSSAYDPQKTEVRNEQEKLGWNDDRTVDEFGCPPKQVITLINAGLISEETKIIDPVPADDDARKKTKRAQARR